MKKQILTKFNKNKEYNFYKIWFSEETIWRLSNKYDQIFDVAEKGMEQLEIFEQKIIKIQMGLKYLLINKQFFGIKNNEGIKYIQFSFSFPVYFPSKIINGQRYCRDWIKTRSRTKISVIEIFREYSQSHFFIE